MKKAGNRSSAPARKAPFTLPEEDGSYIVFGNGKPDKKGKKKEVSAEQNQAGSSENTTRQPDTRTLIGGASWTGKLPVNMLSEHCQKQKWQKPEYTMVIVFWHLFTTGY